MPLSAQGQQPDPAKLKADAQTVVGIISGDKTKIQTYCQISDLTAQIDIAIQEKDANKANELTQRVIEEQKQLGPEYLALVDAMRTTDLSSNIGIVSGIP